MKSYSDELPNVDKNTVDSMSKQLTNVNLIINEIAFDVSKTRRAAAAAAAFSAGTAIASFIALILSLHH